jgi:hydrogenase maturation protease
VVKPLLVMACGNPSRGDDALGPLLIDRLSLDPGPDRHEMETLTDFQLQIEHVLDLAGRDHVIFVDAAVRGPAPFVFVPLRPNPSRSYSTHALSPGALLSIYREVTGEEPPLSHLLAIRGYGFDLGAPLTERAAANLEKALGFLRLLLRRTRIQDDIPRGPGADNEGAPPG